MLLVLIDWAVVLRRPIWLRVRVGSTAVADAAVGFFRGVGGGGVGIVVEGCLLLLLLLVLILLLMLLLMLVLVLVLVLLCVRWRVHNVVDIVRMIGPYWSTGVMLWVRLRAGDEARPLLLWGLETGSAAGAR